MHRGKRAQARGSVDECAGPAPLLDDAAAVKDLAFADEPARDGGPTDGDRPVFHGGTGRAYGSFQEMFEDPALSGRADIAALGRGSARSGRNPTACTG